MFAPTPPHFLQNLFAIFSHTLDGSAWRSRGLVPRGPQEHFQNHRSKLNSLLREPVVQLAPIFVVGMGDNEPVFFELSQPVSQDIGGDSFPRTLELLKRAIPTDHQVANYQQRPTVP